MSATASGREAASYNEERRLAKLARLRGTGRRRRQPQPQDALRSPPPPADPPSAKRSPPPPSDAPPAENWDDVPVGKGRTPQRIDDEPPRRREPRASPTKVPTYKEWDDTPVGGAARPPPREPERKRLCGNQPVRRMHPTNLH